MAFELLGFFHHTYWNAGFSQNSGRKLNVNNVGLVRKKTVRMVTLDSIIITVLSHTKCTHLMLAQGHNFWVSDCRLCRCTLFKMFTDKEKAQCVLWSHSPCEFFCFSSKIKHIFSFPITRWLSVDISDPTILLYNTVNFGDKFFSHLRVCFLTNNYYTMNIANIMKLELSELSKY